jgi:murein L,D-transpeptidase YafK
MRLYRNGQLDSQFEIGLGQGRGQKLVEGDNKTPKGMYFVTNKHRGEFDGDYGKYYGGHWIKINYPNRYDAERGLSNRQISSQQAASIENSWIERAPTLENTELGGGIGFHGWIKEWENSETRHRSWGCVVMHIYDITAMYEKIPAGTMVVIL